MKAVKILLVEDNPGDIELTKEAFKDARMANEITVATDGEVAMARLRKEGQFKNEQLPDIILLDLNLPKLSGLEILAQIKDDSRLKKIPVVILTTSDAESDIINSYENYANCYIKKPVKFDDFLAVVKQIEDFWLTVVKLPDNR